LREHSKAAGPGEETDGFAFVPPYIPFPGRTNATGFFAAVVLCFFVSARAAGNRDLEISDDAKFPPPAPIGYLWPKYLMALSSAIQQCWRNGEVDRFWM
jgi:hypothetical protein